MEIEAGDRPLPITNNPLYKAYFDFAKKHEFRIQRCKSCSTYIHLPREVCPSCSGTDIDWALLSGNAVVDSFIIIARRTNQKSPGDGTPHSGFSDPFVVAQVSPQEAPYLRIVSNILSCAIGDVHIGMPLKVTFMQLTPDYTIPQFVPLMAA